MIPECTSQEATPGECDDRKDADQTSGPTWIWSGSKRSKVWEAFWRFLTLKIACGAVALGFGIFCGLGFVLLFFLLFFVNERADIIFLP